MVAVLVEAPPQTGAVWWIPLLLVLAGLGGAIGLLIVTGDRDRSALRRPGDTLSRLSGLPAWSVCAIALTLWSLTVAFVGFVWDVAWHADLGRDQALFTPPHTMILTGLVGIGVAALTAIVLATLDSAEVGLRFGRLRVPWSSLPMGLMALGAVIGFPLDDYWHATYGIDVTMWSPTHLLMIGGASLTPIAAWLMFAEADVPVSRTRALRSLNEMLATSVLLGLSTFQLEFDLGVPQWQALYHPVLIALAMGVGLVAAREALGRGGALRVTVGFLVTRGVITLLVGPVFGLSIVRVPLYIAGALCVEGVYLVGVRWAPARRVVASALLISTVGLAAEWGWTHAWGLQPWQPRLLAWWWAVVAIALTGALLGSLLGRAVSHREQVLTLRTSAIVVVALFALLAVPYPRHGADAVATVRATPIAAAVPAITRDGLLTTEQDMRVALSLSPQSAADGADMFRVIAWQGGRIVIRDVHPAGAGGYIADGSIPTGGTWKSLVFLARGDVIAAVPVAFPEDRTYGLPAIPAPVRAARASAFQPASTYLTRESHGGSPLPAVLAYTAFGLVAVTWFIALVGVGDAMRRRLHPAVQAPKFIAGALR